MLTPVHLGSFPTPANKSDTIGKQLGFKPDGAICQPQRALGTRRAMSISSTAR
jgi:hypothetical protein